MEGLSADPEERLLRQAITGPGGFPATASLRRLSDGLTPTYLIEAGSAEAVARLTDPAVRTPEEVEFEVDLVGYLERAGLSVAGPYPLPCGKFSVPVAGPGGAEWLLTLFRFLPGQPPELTPDNSLTLGRLLATFHKLADSFATPSFLPVLEREALLAGPVEAVGRRLDGEPGARKKLADLAAYLDRTFDGPAREIGPYGLLHGDAHHHNFLVGDSGELSLFDFEHVATGWRVYDLGTLLWGTLGRGGGAEVWRAMVEGYESSRSLSEWETAVLTRFMALRQLWWLGFHARHWGRWRRPWLAPDFFPQGISLLELIVDEACGQ